MSEKRGPYCNEEGSRVMLPVDGWTLNEARTEAASFARMEMGEYIGRARYLGRQEVSLHDHDDWESCRTCPAEPVWAFETYERV